MRTAVAAGSAGPLESARLRDLALVGLTISAGCVDAITWLGLGKVFAAFMTGNLAFLGFTAGGASGPSLPRVLAATIAFGAGAAIGARIVRIRRDAAALWPRRVSAALAVGLALQTTFLVLWLAVNADPGSASGDALIVLSAMAMGIQTSAIFSLGVRAEFTTAATATLAVLMGDLAGWKQPRGERGRLSATLAALVAGALTGTVLMTHASSWAPVFPLAVTAAVLAVAAIQLHERGDSTEPHRALSVSEGT
jgi:uncharacterized membrane protein YoaK (UPF0700 family)